MKRSHPRDQPGSDNCLVPAVDGMPYMAIICSKMVEAWVYRPWLKVIGVATFVTHAMS
jgi:hypothetical protein